VADLKLTGVTALAHKYMRWSKGMKLTVHDIELRRPDWEEMLPKGEGGLDIDAIAEKCQKKVGGKMRFASKLIHLVIAIPHDLYEIALANHLREDVDALDVLKVIDF
jgi:hypothetical protein